FDQPIPPLIEKRLRTRMTGLELSRSRRLRAIAAAAAVVVILIAGAIGYAIFDHRRTEQVNAHVETLRKLLNQQLYGEARSHLDQLATTAPGVAADPDIQALAVELAQAVREEESRLSGFNRSIELAENAGPDQPDREALEIAKRLARLDAEKSRVLKLEAAIAEVDRKQQMKRDEDFLARLKEISTTIDKLDRDTPDEVALS